MNPNKITELLPIYDMELYPLAKHSMVLNGDAEKIEHAAVLVLLMPDDQTETLLALLQKMLLACQLNTSQYTIQYVQPADLLDTIQVHQPETVLMFGILPDSDAFHFDKPLNKPFRFGGRKFLITNTLKEIDGNQQLKAALWTNGLKPLFQIS
jgi:DNA polymerase III psi subunit